jgi:23S rRNA (pseudouridine1915-N3)-methyltransferase
MFKLIAVGRLKKSPHKDLINEYLKRLTSRFKLIELDQKQSSKDEAHEIMKRIGSDDYLIVLDERGKDLRSMDLAKKIEQLQVASKNIAFVIGGADGVTEELRSKANLLLSFGRATWPHMLVRVMLIEQIYRAEQIRKGHPYHREG